MNKTLVIVESPTKAKTIAKFLGSEYRIEPSMGHVRDLPKSSMGINIENGTFAPDYEINEEKKKKVNELKKIAKTAEKILFATDEDREGEAISWHLAEILGIPENEVKRLVFHEITKEAITHSLSNPRPLNLNLVNAQQARRILDRLVGYELSPLLWKKVRFGLSAGRVQSAAVHLIVLREKERAEFKKAEYYDLLAELEAENIHFPARLISYQNKKIPSGKDFDENGKLKNPENFILFNKNEISELAENLKKNKWQVQEIEENRYETSPYAPFITSTLQQEGSRKFGWSAKFTMRTAQSLYEKGYITYMRTDSTNLSEQAIHAAREAADEFGVDYLPEKPRFYSTKTKNAEEAHEAIRPAGSKFRHPIKIASELESEESKLYELIWKRTVASQMKNAEMLRTVAKISSGEGLFEAKGKKIIFPGYLRAYVEGADDIESELEHKEELLPELKTAQAVLLKNLKPEEHQTEPPPRYSEATLIKKMESEGVGRPSTYASIMETILERDYVYKSGNTLIPTFTAIIVDKYLQEYFSALVDIRFTSKMEEDLDKIASGENDWQPYIKNFYNGDSEFSFHKEIEKAMEITEYPQLIVGDLPESGEKIVVKSGKYGPYLQVNDNNFPIPDALPPAELTVQKVIEIINEPSEKIIGKDPASGFDITYKSGRYGPYLQIGEDTKEKKAKKIGLTYGPKRIPISQTLNINNLTEADILNIISLPKNLGNKDEKPVKISAGRFGPYISWNDEFRSIPKNYDIFSITLEQASAILDMPKKGRQNKKIILKELGKDPGSGEEIKILDGKYGPYIAGPKRKNVSLGKEITIEKIDLNTALEMLKTKKKRNKKK